MPHDAGLTVAERLGNLGTAPWMEAPSTTCLVEELANSLGTRKLKKVWFQLNHSIRRELDRNQLHSETATSPLGLSLDAGLARAHGRSCRLVVVHSEGFPY